MKNIITIAIILVGTWGAFAIFGGDKYVGFYYPDPDNLLYDIQSDKAFGSIQECREWVETQADIHNADGPAFDYECGKNCDLSGGKPYICEETLQ